MSVTVPPTSSNVGNPTCGGSVWAPKQLSLFTMSACAIICVVATGGNGLIVSCVVKDPFKRLRTPFNYFLVNLAGADLILGGTIMPLAVYTHYMESIGELTPELNNLIRMTYFIVGMASLLNMIALSLDRYVAITRAIKYRIFFSWRHCVIVSVCLWVISTSFPFVYFIMGAVNYYMLFACAAILTGLCVLIVIYVKVYQFLRRRTIGMMNEASRTVDQNTQLKKLLQEKKVTRTFMVIILLFVLTYIPAAVMSFVLYFWKTDDCISRHVLRDLQSVLISSNSCVNPFICIIRLTNFRRSVKHILRRRNRSVEPKGSSTTQYESSTTERQERPERADQSIA